MKSKNSKSVTKAEFKKYIKQDKKDDMRMIRQSMKKSKAKK